VQSHWKYHTLPLKHCRFLNPLFSFGKQPSRTASYFACIYCSWVTWETNATYYCYSVTICSRTFETLPALHQLTFFSTIFSAAFFLERSSLRLDKWFLTFSPSRPPKVIFLLLTPPLLWISCKNKRISWSICLILRFCNKHQVQGFVKAFQGSDSGPWIKNRVPRIGEIIIGSLESEKSGPCRSIPDI